MFLHRNQLAYAGDVDRLAVGRRVEFSIRPAAGSPSADFVVVLD